MGGWGGGLRVGGDRSRRRGGGGELGGQESAYFTRGPCTTIIEEMKG